MSSLLSSEYPASVLQRHPDQSRCSGSQGVQGCSERRPECDTYQLPFLCIACRHESDCDAAAAEGQDDNVLKETQHGAPSGTKVQNVGSTGQTVVRVSGELAGKPRICCELRRTVHDCCLTLGRSVCQLPMITKVVGPRTRR